MKRLFAALCFAAPLLAVQIPAGTELSVRLTEKVATDAKPPATTVNAVLIAPVILNRAIVIAPGAQLGGTVKQAKAAAEKRPLCWS